LATNWFPYRTFIKRTIRCGIYGVLTMGGNIKLLLGVDVQVLGVDMLIDYEVVIDGPLSGENLLIVTGHRLKLLIEIGAHFELW
jgi:hypothetical protein